MSDDREFEPFRGILNLRAIAPEKRNLLRHLGERVNYEAGQALFSEGESVQFAYVVVEGAVEIATGVPNRSRATRTAWSGDIVGQAAIFGDDARRATAVARTRVEALRIPIETFSNTLRRDSSTGMRVSTTTPRIAPGGAEHPRVAHAR